MRFLSRFVDSNDRELRRLQPMVDEANALEAEFEALSDEQIRAQMAEIREEIHAVAQPDDPSDDEPVPVKLKDIQLDRLRANRR